MSTEEREQFKAPPTNPPECNSMASEARLCAQSAMFACQAFECGKVQEGVFAIRRACILAHSVLEKSYESRKAVQP